MGLVEVEGVVMVWWCFYFLFLCSQKKREGFLGGSLSVLKGGWMCNPRSPSPPGMMMSSTK